MFFKLERIFQKVGMIGDKVRCLEKSRTGRGAGVANDGGVSVDPKAAQG